jgi:2',3'-cyclic-nucleotide 2'-phosphodiesterase (5'-nucleotidase family)
LPLPAVDLFHFNDFHRRLGPLPNGHGGAARLTTLAREQLAAHPDSVLINLGDVAGDQSEHGPRAFEPIPRIFNRMGVGLSALGNHEFEDSANDYRSLREGYIARMGGDVLCANVTDAHGEGFAKPYVMRNLAGVSVAFIGVVTENLTSALFPAAGAGLHAAHLKEVLARLVPEVRAKGAEAVVVLAHEGLRGSQALAREVPGVDLVIAGHDHRSTDRPIEIEREDGSRAWVAEAGAYGEALGHLRLEVDSAARRVVGVSGSLIPVTDQIAPDPTVAAIVEKWQPLPHAEHVPMKTKWRTVRLEDLKQALQETDDRPAGETSPGVENAS